MPRYEVEVEYTQQRMIKVWARDEAVAEEKAAEIVEGWDGVVSAEATGNTEEIED